MESPINILIVDDEAKNLTVLETVLNDPGYRVVRAESADKALLALVAEEFALLILDIQMPGMTGFELAQVIKERKKTAVVPIIFLTAYYNEDQHVLEGYGTGAVDYLNKPVNPAILRSKVAVFAELHRRQRESIASNRALRAEVIERRRAEEQLRELNETLDRRVNERTKALRESEHFLGRVAQVTPGVLQVFDLVDRRAVFINRAFGSLLGFRPDQIQAMGPEAILRLMHPDDMPQFEEHLARVRSLGEGEVADFEHRLRDQSGEWHWFRSHDAVFARDAAGDARQLIGVALEITGRKQAEEAMGRNAALFSTLIAQAPMGTYVVDAQLRLRQVNAEAMPVFASVEPLIGRDLREVMEILWGLEVGGQCVEIFRHTLVTGERYISPPFTKLRQDLGVEQTYEWETQRVTLPDGQHGVVCYFHEVTERARAAAALQAGEQRMRLAAEATGVGVWEWNVITNTIHWDAQMFRLYGVPPTEGGLVTYETWSGAVVPGELARQEEVLRDTVQRQGQSTREFRIVRASDRECRVIQSVETVRTNADGKAEWVVGTNLDVTERRCAELAILEQARRKDEFLAMLGHELRNPLNAIRYAVQIAHETPDDRDACQWASDVIDRQSQQLTRMVEDLLDVARINRGRVELRPEPLDLGAVLERAIAVVRPLIAQRRHSLQTTIGSPLRVAGDAARLEQVFVNLLNNAAKYTPEGGSLVLLAQADDSEVEVVIRDNGVGIAAELLPHVFELFRQGDSSLDRAQGGLGIGLSVVRSLVEMHRGRVLVESGGPTSGTTVTVRLPKLDEEPTGAIARAATGTEGILAGNVRVLVVDDHVDAAQSLARLLRQRGCDVRVAHSGPEGVTAAGEFLPTTLLLDLGLPGFDGYELARILRAHAPFANALFIAVSGYAQDGDRERSLAAGFDEHFAKPLDFPRVIDVIRSRGLK